MDVPFDNYRLLSLILQLIKGSKVCGKACEKTEKELKRYTSQH